MQKSHTATYDLYLKEGFYFLAASVYSFNGDNKIYLINFLQELDKVYEVYQLILGTQ